MIRYTKFFVFALIACVLFLGFVKTNAVNFERPLTVGSTGSDVSTLQQILKDLGLFNAQVTGFFGPITQTAVEAFQTKYSLASQGVVGYGFVGPKTRELLNTFTPSSTHTSSSPATQAVSTPTVSISRDLYVGLQGEDVRQLQSFLKERGYFNHPQITGYFGEVTRNAVIAFQQANGIDALGRVGPQTRAKIVNTINLLTSTVSSTQNTIQNSVVTRPVVRSGVINNNSDVPNLVVTVSDNDADNAVAQNQDLTYTLTIDNTGDGLATGVDITDTISGDVGNVGTFGFSSCGSSYTNNSTGSTVSIDNVEIAVATNCVITYHVSVDSDATDASTITNSADVSAATEGGNNPSATNASTLTVDAPLVSFWADGESVGNLTSTADWQEISGITNPTVAANSSYIWMQSDGSIDKIFAVNTSNAASAGEWTLSGINGSDYEDLSSARVDDESYIYLADMGDNANARSTIIIYRIKEPTVTGSNGTVDAGDIEAITMEYPAGSLPTHKDAETLLVDPDTGDMYIITKRESVPGVYYLAHQVSYSGTQTLTDLGNMYDIPDVGSISATGNAVGGNISPNGEEILIKSYNVMYLFPRDKGTQTIYQALQQTPTVVEGYVGGGNTTYRKSHPSQEPQGEAVTFDYDGNHYYTASEFASTEGSTASRFPLFKYARASETPTTATFQEGASSYAGTSDTYIWDGTVTPSNSSTVRGTETTIVVDTTTVANNDERKGLLKFDISSIPSNATIIGAHLDLYISTEGQGWKMHRVLVDWNESSTYDTLTGGIDDDNTDASTVEDNRNGVTLDGITGSIVNNMKLATVQGWVDGTYNNYGWLIEGTDLTTGDGQQFVSSEGVTSTQRPKLTVRYTTP